MAGTSAAVKSSRAELEVLFFPTESIHLFSMVIILVKPLSPNSDYTLPFVPHQSVAVRKSHCGFRLQQLQSCQAGTDLTPGSARAEKELVCFLGQRVGSLLPERHVHPSGQCGGERPERPLWSICSTFHDLSVRNHVSRSLLV
jgi:hypothetical protein